MQPTTTVSRKEFTVVNTGVQCIETVVKSFVFNTAVEAHAYRNTCILREAYLERYNEAVGMMHGARECGYTDIQAEQQRLADEWYAKLCEVNTKISEMEYPYAGSVNGDPCPF